MTRLENYKHDPKAYLQRIFDFLGLSEAPTDWSEILDAKQANVHRQHRADMLQETHDLLSDFYRPYNLLFASFLNNPEYAFSELNSADRGEEELEREEEKHEPFRVNQHGLERHMEHDPHEGSSLLHEGAKGLMDALHINTGEMQPGGANYPSGEGHLRGRRPEQQQHQRTDEQASETVAFTPRAFSTEGLPPVPSLDTISTFSLLEPFNAFDIDDAKRVLQDPVAAAHQLCISAYGLDLAAVKFLLYDVGK